MFYLTYLEKLFIYFCATRSSCRLEIIWYHAVYYCIWFQLWSFYIEICCHSRKEQSEQHTLTRRKFCWFCMIWKETNPMFLLSCYNLVCLLCFLSKHCLKSGTCDSPEKMGSQHDD